MCLCSSCRINWLRQVGLLDAWRHQFWPRPNKCSDPMEKKAPSSNDIKPMRLEQIKGPFTLLCVGIAFAFFVLIFEVIWKRGCDQINTRHRGH